MIDFAFVGKDNENLKDGFKYWRALPINLNMIKFCKIYFRIFDKSHIMNAKEEILQILKTNKSEFLKLGICEIGLFGSYGRNEQSTTSDIDLLIDFDPGKENFDNLMKIYDFLENLFPSKNIEIITKNGLSSHIGPSILKEVQYA